MGKKLYVGNLPYSVDQQALQDAFSAFGTVDSAIVISDRDTGRSKGFGFVEMSSDSEAQKAIDELNGTSMDNRQITVNEARPRAPRTGGGGGYGGGGGGGNRW
jgi:RNA recognition motif-containing protein